jgi:hypothetical protein
MEHLAKPPAAHLARGQWIVGDPLGYLDMGFAVDADVLVGRHGDRLKYTGDLLRLWESGPSGPNADLSSPT